jgi:hypothetical protein
MNILRAIADPLLFGRHFQGDSWHAWRAFLAVLFGLPVADAEADVVAACTAGSAPQGPFREAWLVCGRRAGKSFIDAADPDVAVLDAIRPAMATIPNSMLLCGSSPYAQRGALFDAYRRWHGKADAPVLVWHAATRTMNSLVPQSVIDQAMERDPASAEYLAQFRCDVGEFLSREVVEACVSRGAHERAPISGVKYFGFADPSGGSSDSFTLAVAHREDERIVVDAIRERRPPFSPESVVAEFAGLVKSYRAGLRGDRYAGEWPREAFRRHGVEYMVAGKDRSAIYVEALPLFNSGKVDLLDHQRCASQFCQLQRRTGRGRDVIDHPPGGHDDVCNAVVTRSRQPTRRLMPSLSDIGPKIPG